MQTGEKPAARPGSKKAEWILEKSVGGMLSGVTPLKVSGPIITAGSSTVFPLSARSQMAEAFLNSLRDDKFTAEGAGLEPGVLNPRAVQVMKEVGIDITGKGTNSVFEFFKQDRKYRYVITVCDESSGERCPLFPGKTVRLHWSFEDPSAFTGTEEEILEKTRRARVQAFIAESDV